MLYIVCYQCSPTHLCYGIFQKLIFHSAEVET